MRYIPNVVIFHGVMVMIEVQGKHMFYYDLHLEDFFFPYCCRGIWLFIPIS